MLWLGFVLDFYFSNLHCPHLEGKLLNSAELKSEIKSEQQTSQSLPISPNSIHYYNSRKQQDIRK